MGNPDNIVGQGFHTNPERISGGRPKGSKNRKTLFRQFMFLDADDKDPNGNFIINPYTGERATNEHIIAMKAVLDAKNGDKDARRDSLDATYGKVPDIILDEQEDEEDVNLDETDPVKLQESLDRINRG